MYIRNHKSHSPSNTGAKSWSGLPTDDAFCGVHPNHALSVCATPRQANHHMMPKRERIDGIYGGRKSTVSVAKMILLVAFLGIAEATTTSYVDEPELSGYWAVSQFLDTPGASTLEDVCTATDDDGAGAAVWDSITMVLNSIEHSVCPRGGNNTYQAIAYNTKCAGAYCNTNDCGRLCQGDYCAHGCNGDKCGQGCVGLRCAGYAQGGCPPLTGSDFDTAPSEDQFETAITLTGIYDTCCGTEHGSGCVGTECAYHCKSNKCGRMSIGYRSAHYCQGQLCGSSCQGEQCSDGCRGDQCGTECWGKHCARNCTGPACGQQCAGELCATNCSGTSCGRNCKGYRCAKDCDSATCGQYCQGEECAASCTNSASGANNGCGQWCKGTHCCANSVGHQACAYCVGHGCARNASSSFTTTTLTGGYHDNPYEATFCYNEWVAGITGVNTTLRAIPDAFAPTAAPTFAPTFAPTAAPTAAPTFAPTAAPAGRRARDLGYDTTPMPYKRARERRGLLVGDTLYDASACAMTLGPNPSTNAAKVIGPGYKCIGDECASGTTGTFAGAGCAGSYCASTATGLYAGVACTGTMCAYRASSTEYGAGAHCYGHSCAKLASGPWAGAFCIGNHCAQGCTGYRCGTCCVGRNCSSNSTGLCPTPTDGGVPLDMGGANELFSDSCRANIDTDSSEWTSYMNACAGGKSSSQLVHSFGTDGTCVLACTDELTSFLRYYSERLNNHAYANTYVAMDARTADPTLPNTSTDENEDTIIGISVAAGVVGVVAIGFAVYFANNGGFEGFRSAVVEKANLIYGYDNDA